MECIERLKRIYKSWIEQRSSCDEYRVLFSEELVPGKLEELLLIVAMLLPDHYVKDSSAKEKVFEYLRDNDVDDAVKGYLT